MDSATTLTSDSPREHAPTRRASLRRRGVTVDAVQFAAQRVDSDITWQEDACAKLVKVPRVFVTRVIRECVKAAEGEGVTEIAPESLERIRDNGSGEGGGSL
jgi:hypothetical protein